MTLFGEYIANGGTAADQGLLLFQVDDDRVVPTAFLEAPGKLNPLVVTINTICLGGTAAQKLVWWTSPSIHLGGKAPIDFVNEPTLRQREILVSMARSYRPYKHARKG